MIVCVGCKVYVEGLLVEDLGIKLIECGLVEVNDWCVIFVDGVYVIGDLVCGLMFVYKVMEEGVMVVECMYGYVV